MKRTTMFLSLALIALVIPGCSTASAQCPGGRCYTASVWSPWAGIYYSNSPCAGGRCRTAAKPAEPEEPVAEPADPEAGLPITGVSSLADAHADATAAGKPPRARIGGFSLEPASALATAKPGAENCPRGSRPGAENRPPRLADTAPQLVEFKPFCLRVAEIVNAQRAALGLAPLQLDENLCSGCDRHSAWMASGGGFQHAYYAGARECIAYGVRSPEAVVNLWLNSSGHRAIILGGGKTLGVGCSGNYWTLRVR